MNQETANLYRKLDLPEVCELKEKGTLVEFSVSLQDPNPEQKMLRLMSDYMSDVRRPLFGIFCTYYVPDDSISFLHGVLVTGQPLDEEITPNTEQH
jgi:hypothetical protein